MPRRITARDIHKLADRVDSGRILRSGSAEVDGTSAGSMLSGSADAPINALWGRLVSAYFTDVPPGSAGYTFTPIRPVNSDPWWADDGSDAMPALEVGGVFGLDGSIVRLHITSWDWRFRWHRRGCVHLCVVAFKEKDWCESFAEGGTPDCDVMPWGIEDAAVTIERVEDDLSLTEVWSGTTDVMGRACLAVKAGHYRITVHPDGCNQYSQDITLTCDHATHTVGFSFCCWALDMDPIDHDTESPVDGVAFADFGCLEGICTDETGSDMFPASDVFDGRIVGRCDGFDPCPNPTPPPEPEPGPSLIWLATMGGSAPGMMMAARPTLGSGAPPETTDGYPCDSAVQLGGTPEPPLIPCHAEATTADYWKRCFPISNPCDVPAEHTAKTVELYSKDQWVKNECCGCEVTDWRPREVLPKVVHATIYGPEAIVGGGGARVVTLTYDPASSIPVPGSGQVGRLVYLTDCLESGGWGWEWGTGYLCRRIINPLLPCDDGFGGTNYLATFLNHWIAKRYYGSAQAKLTITMLAGPGGDTSLQCKASLLWTNYWNPDCNPTDPDPDHVLQQDGSPRDDCSCGTTIPGYTDWFFPTCIYNTKSVSVPFVGGTNVACGPLDLSDSTTIERSCSPPDTLPVSATVTE